MTTDLNSVTTKLSRHRLTRQNAILLLVDHQLRFVTGSNLSDQLVLLKNVIGLARVARLLGIPIVATTSLARGIFGPLLPSLAAALADSEVIDRATVDPFEEPRVVEAIAKTERRNLIVASARTSVCTVFLPAMSARTEGYGVYVAMDASGAFDETERVTAIRRLTRAGVVVANFNSIVIEMLADSVDPVGTAISMDALVRQACATERRRRETVGSLIGRPAPARGAVPGIPARQG